MDRLEPFWSSGTENPAQGALLVMSKLAAVCHCFHSACVLICKLCFALETHYCYYWKNVIIKNFTRSWFPLYLLTCLPVCELFFVPSQELPLLVKDRLWWVSA